MPIKVGTENAVRVYKQQYVDRGVIPPGGYYLPYDFDPSGYACVMGSVATYNGRYYDCRQVEVSEMKNTLGEMIHRRTTISFNSDGGSSVASQVKTWGVENVTQPTNPTKSGWSIAGWATTIKAPSANVTFPILAPENNTTYYAVWQTTITWKKYNGTTLKSEALVYGATSTAPTGTSDTTQYDYSWPQNSVVVTGPQTITETRTTKSYTITWKAYNGTTLKSQTLAYGSTSTAPTGTTDTVQYDYSWPKASTSVTGNETITEIRTTKSYTITWKAYNGAILDSETLPYGATSTAPTGTSDTTQYDYAWPKSSTTVVGTETITETRTTKSYTITWKSYTNVTLKSETLTYGSTSTAPIGTSDTTQYDYSWPKSSTTVVGTETITETRVGRSYTVTFYENGGTSPNPASKSVTYGSTYGALATTSRTGYTFAGWFTASIGGTKITSTTTVTTAGHHSLFAQWTGIPITVTFNANGGTTPSPTSKSVTYGSTYGTLATTSRANYTFNGWFTARSGGTKITSASQVTQTTNHTLYAQWTSSIQQTSAPSISNSTGPRDIYTMYRVRNNDTSSATIYSDAGTTPPTTSRGLIASGAQTASISTGWPKAISGGVIYARAQASGKTMSTVTSMYLE